MNHAERKEYATRCAGWIKDHTYTLLTKGNGAEVWRCQQPGTHNLAFDISMSRYGMSMHGDTGGLMFDVGSSYGLSFLAGGDDEYQYSKLDPCSKQTEFDHPYLIEVVYDAIVERLNETVEGLPVWKVAPTPMAERCLELSEWLMQSDCADEEHSALVVALRAAERFEGGAESAHEWLQDHEELLGLSDTWEYTLRRPTKSVWRRLFYLRHAARQILAQLAAKASPKVQYAYCLDKGTDRWSDGDIAMIVSDEDLSAGAVISRGVVIRSSASDFLPDAGDVFEHMANQANDQNSEYCDNFPDESEALKAELTELLEPIKVWADCSFPVNFYNVEKMGQYTVTAEDVEAARAYERTRDLAAAGAV